MDPFQLAVLTCPHMTFAGSNQPPGSSSPEDGSPMMVGDQCAPDSRVRFMAEHLASFAVSFAEWRLIACS